MPRMEFGRSAEERSRGDLPQLPVVNMFGERAPTEEAGVILQSRPGLDDNGTTLGSGPVRRVFRRDGVLGGEFYAVSGSTLYRGGLEVGGIGGGGAVSLAGYSDMLFIAAGGPAYVYDGSNLTALSFPDGASVAKVVILAARAVFLRADTEQFYWTDVLDDVVDGLSFATAENQPDRLRDILAIDDVLVLFGAETVEFWPNTPDADLPYAPLEGRVFEVGTRATGCATTWGSTFAWVGSDHVVYVNGQEPVPISNPGLQTKIEASDTCQLSTFHLDGQEFLQLRLDAQTYAIGSVNGLWSEMKSDGAANWLPQCFDGGVFGCSDGRTAIWSSGHEDFSGVLERRFRAGFPINGGSVTLDNIMLRCNTGQTPYLSGTYSAPTVEMRLSDDAGRTWCPWEPVPLGAQGEYGAITEWDGLGMGFYPGILAEFRVTDPVDFRVSDVLVNEPYGGR